MPIKGKLKNKQIKAMGIDRVDNGEIEHKEDKKNIKNRNNKK
ncbi:hypothetical protein [uncultured Clostridium sp.]|nr:hypothetical protein [uncultured Clostridium sp.]